MHVLWPMPSSITTISTFRVARIERSSVSNAGLRPASDGDGSCSPPGHFYSLDSTSYAPMIYCEDVYQDVFRKTLAGDESLTETDITMQRLYVGLLKSGWMMSISAMFAVCIRRLTIVRFLLWARLWRIRIDVDSYHRPHVWVYPALCVAVKNPVCTYQENLKCRPAYPLHTSAKAPGAVSESLMESRFDK